MAVRASRTFSQPVLCKRSLKLRLRRHPAEEDDLPHLNPKIGGRTASEVDFVQLENPRGMKNLVNLRKTSIVNSDFLDLVARRPTTQKLHSAHKPLIWGFADAAFSDPLPPRTSSVPAPPHTRFLVRKKFTIEVFRSFEPRFLDLAAIIGAQVIILTRASLIGTYILFWYICLL